MGASGAASTGRWALAHGAPPAPRAPIWAWDGRVPLWHVCSVGGKIWFMRAKNFMGARLLRRRCGRHGRFARLCGSHGRPVDVLAALGRRRGHLHHHFLLSWLTDSPRRPRATRRSRPSSPTAAHEGPPLIFDSSSRSRVSIARASRQPPRLFQMRASRREAPKIASS